MALTLEQVHALQSDTTLRNKIAAALLVWASGILASTDVGDTSDEKAGAIKVAQNAQAYAAQMQGALIASFKETAADEAAITGASDAAIQTAVTNMVVRLFFGAAGSGA